MDETYEAYPLQWPEGYPRCKHPQPSRFGRTRWSEGRTEHSLTLFKARLELEREVRRLGGASLVISTNMRTRKDGGVYSSAAEPSDSGAAVYFRLEGEWRALACDTWATVKENLHALALGIAALRGLDRWGIPQMLKRVFTGFLALPQPGARSWWEIFGVSRDADIDEVEAVYREAMKENHPDRGGDHERAAELTAAIRAARRQAASEGR